VGKSQPALTAQPQKIKRSTLVLPEKPILTLEQAKAAAERYELAKLTAQE
jgi:hypothetical protein